MGDSDDQNCYLCEKNRELCNSHIISEFLYKPLYDNKGRLFGMSTKEDTRRSFDIEQKGLREYLLCQSCETQLSRYENYARDLFHNDRFRVNGNTVEEIENLNYKKLRLFFISILWRSSISSRPFFRNVDLGPHEETARKMILNEDPDPWWRYGCALSDIADYDEDQRGVIIQPVSSQEGAHHHYFYVLGGFLWHYVVSSHRAEDSVEELFLERNGSMMVISKNPESIPFLRQLRAELDEQGKLGDLIERYGDDEE
jgi:hypothetical protein